MKALRIYYVQLFALYMITIIYLVKLS